MHASQIEPCVGMIKGIGPALFAYLRMRSGANAIKPDILVRAGLVGLGLDLPMDDHAMLVITATLSEQTGIRLLELDQLLWWQRENEEAQGIS